MAHYILSDEFIQLPENKGIVENISGFRAEIAVTPNAGTGYILYPFTRLAFNTTIYAARAQGEAGTSIIATIPFTECGCDNAVSAIPAVIEKTDCCCCCADCCDVEVADLDVDEVNNLIDLYCDKGAFPNDTDYVMAVNSAIKKYFEEKGSDDNDCSATD